jgi:hypothetical protein
LAIHFIYLANQTHHMKKNLHFVITLFISCILFGSCKKDSPDNGPDPVVSTTSDTYQPLTTGSYWKYASTGLSTGTTEMTITANTKTFNGKKFQLVTVKSNSNTAPVGYYYANNHVYTLRQETGGYGYLQFTYLKDNAAVNASWKESVTDNGTLNGVPAQMIGKIIAKAITKTVAGKTYKDVIHTKVQLQYALYSSTYETFGNYDYYIAKGIGIIEIDSDLSGSKSVMALQTYTIK